MTELHSKYVLETNLKAFGTAFWRKYGVMPTMTQLKRIYATKDASDATTAFRRELLAVLKKEGEESQ